MAASFWAALSGGARWILVLRSGWVVDPASGRDEFINIAFAEGKVAAVGAGLAHEAAETIDARGLLVVPGRS